MCKSVTSYTESIAKMKSGRSIRIKIMIMVVVEIVIRIFNMTYFISMPREHLYLKDFHLQRTTQFV
jgi:hypothetical protein